MEKTNVMVELYICGDEKLNPYEISKLLKIEPTLIRLKGEDIKGFSHKWKDNHWELNTGYKNSYDINKQILTLYNKLKDKKDIIKSILENKTAYSEFMIVVNVEQGQFPAMYFKKEFIEFLAYTGVEVGFDMYFFSDAPD